MAKAYTKSEPRSPRVRSHIAASQHQFDLPGSATDPVHGDVIGCSRYRVERDEAGGTAEGAIVIGGYQSQRPKTRPSIDRQQGVERAARVLIVTGPEAGQAQDHQSDLPPALPA